MAVRIDKSKNLDRALKSHLQELENFYFGDKSKEKPELSETEVKYLNSTFAADADLPTRPGRPLAHRTRNERTFQSFQAFAFVTGRNAYVQNRSW